MRIAIAIHGDAATQSLSERSGHQRAGACRTGFMSTRPSSANRGYAGQVTTKQPPTAGRQSIFDPQVVIARRDVGDICGIDPVSHLKPVRQSRPAWEQDKRTGAYPWLDPSHNTYAPDATQKSSYSDADTPERISRLTTSSTQSRTDLLFCVRALPSVSPGFGSRWCRPVPSREVWNSRATADPSAR